MNIKTQIKKELKHLKQQNKKIFCIKHKQNEYQKASLLQLQLFKTVDLLNLIV
jgi:hypothetical protein